jgi:serine/threonine-protein kinase
LSREAVTTAGYTRRDVCRACFCNVDGRLTVVTPFDADWTGRVFGARFRVARTIKQGGMGAVYVAIDTTAGDREVALKVVRRALSEDPDAIARFKRETRLLATLQDEHVVTAIEAGEDGGVLWIAMELLEGISLRECLEQRGRFPWRQSLPVVRQLALALGAAHGLGIIHRDLKPENVMLVGGPENAATFQTPRIKLLDFGVAKQRRDDDDGRTHQTGTGQLLGTPGYVAPEAVLEGITDDPRSDFYALGVTWFELLVGAPPFTAKTPMALAMRHVHEIPPSPSSLLPYSPVPAPVEALLARLLAKRPDERPADARALVEAIDALATAALQQPALPTLGAEQPTERDRFLPVTGVLAFGTDAGAVSAGPTPAQGSATAHTPLHAPIPSTTTPPPPANDGDGPSPKRRWLAMVVVALLVGGGGVAVGARLASAPTRTTATPTSSPTATTTTATTAPTTTATTTTATTATNAAGPLTAVPARPTPSPQPATPAVASTTALAAAPSAADPPKQDPPAGAASSSSTRGERASGVAKVAGTRPPAGSRANNGAVTTTVATASAPPAQPPAGVTQLSIVALPRSAGWKVSVDGAPARPTPFKVDVTAGADHTLSFSSPSNTDPIVRVVRYPAGAATFQEDLTP